MAPLAAVLVAAALSDEPARATYERAVSHHKAGRPEEAASGYRDLLKEHPRVVAARVYLAETLWLSGRVGEARDELETVRRVAPEPLLPHLLLARLDGSESRELTRRIPAPALRARLLRNALLEGESFVPMERPAVVLASLGEIDLALGDYRVAAEIDPWNVDLHRHLGIAFSKASRHREAIEALESAVALEPKDAGSWGQLGSSALRLQWWDRAIEAFRRANELSGERPAGLLALGYAYERKPDFHAALSLYERAAELAPAWAQPPYRMGRTLIKLDRRDDAERALKRALDLEEGHVEARCFLGALYLEDGDLTKAARELEHSIAISPRYPKAHYYLAQAYSRAGRLDEARAELTLYEELVREVGDTDPQ
jgi:tetratricopeptide (TPR) repeat protein